MLANRIIRAVVGVLFVVAAILKLLSIDEFEIYIYSFNVFNFLVTTFASRLLIAGEFILGIFLILNVYYKFTKTAVLTTLVFFTLFLIYTALFRNDDNCHCFGDFVKLNPLESILKNIVVFVLMLLHRQKSAESNHRAWIPLSIVSSTLLIIFIITPPDSIYNKIYSSEKEISSIDLYESFDEIVKINFENDGVSLDSTVKFKASEGKQMIAVASSGCKYCKLGLKRLSMMMGRGESDVEKVDVFIWGSPESIVSFREETTTSDYSYWHILPSRAIDITFGRFPIFIRMEDGEIVKVSDFRAVAD